MSKPKVLIVGCGAVGLSQGYHLAPGAEITYLVRPGRKPAFVPPKRLYDYKENALRVFENYRVVESTSDLAGEEFLFVLDTLDGHTARSEGGTATLRDVGALIRNTNAFVAYDAIGIDMDVHYAETMGISKSRLNLAFSMLAHQPTPMISIPPGADRALIAQADLLYIGLPGDVGLGTFKTDPKAAKIMQETYGKNLKLKLGTYPSFLASLLSINMMHMTTWNIDGWRPVEQFYANKPLWKLMMQAQSEILALPRYGWTGKILSWVLASVWVTQKAFFSSMVDGAKPMVMHEFHAFHHGGKVVKQDIATCVDVLREGERAGRKMPALREIIRQGEETEKRKEEARGKVGAQTGDLTKRG